MGVPYVPIVGLVGTHLLERRDDMVIVVDPFDGKTKSVVAKALRPDVAIFHVRTADRQGNVSCGYWSENVLLAECASQVIVTAEEVVDEIVEKDAVGTWMPGILVDTVVHALMSAVPGGPHQGGISSSGVAPLCSVWGLKRGGASRGDGGGRRDLRRPRQPPLRYQAPKGPRSSRPCDGSGTPGSPSLVRGRSLSDLDPD